MGKDIADQVHSQNSANQFLQYGALLQPVMEGMAIMQKNLTGQKPDVLEVVEGKNYRTKAQIRREEQERMEKARATLAARQASIEATTGAKGDGDAESNPLKSLVTMAQAKTLRGPSAAADVDGPPQRSDDDRYGGGGGGAKDDGPSAPAREEAKKPKDPLEGKQFGKRRPRKKKFRSKIPWELLDTLDVQKQAVADVGKAQLAMRREAAKNSSRK